MSRKKDIKKVHRWGRYLRGLLPSMIPVNERAIAADSRVRNSMKAKRVGLLVSPQSRRLVIVPQKLNTWMRLSSFN